MVPDLRAEVRVLRRHRVVPMAANAHDPDMGPPIDRLGVDAGPGSWPTFCGGPVIPVDVPTAVLIEPEPTGTLVVSPDDIADREPRNARADLVVENDVVAERKRADPADDGRGSGGSSLRIDA